MQRVVLPFALALLLGCGGKKQPEPAPQQSAPVGLQAASDAGSAAGPGSASDGAAPVVQAALPQFLGVVRGVVRLAEGAELPLAKAPVMAGETAPAVDKSCPPVDLNDQRRVRRAQSGGLSPFHVAVTQMSAAPPRMPRVHELAIDGCRLRPEMLAVMRGDTVRVVNHSDTAFLPMLPGDKFMRGIMPGESREFVAPLGNVRLRCEFASYCGESTVVGLSHPLFAVSDEEGRFVIEHVPLGQELKLHAWNPLFTVSTVSFALSTEAPEKTIDVTVTPRPGAGADKAPEDAGRPKGKGAKKR